MNPESSHPFGGEFETLKTSEGFDVHKLDTASETISFPEGLEREFRQNEYAVTEYFSQEGKNHEAFVRLKKFYEAAQQAMGEYLPESFFVEGEPSSGEQGQSFYVVQKFDNPEFNQTAKALGELNSQEFSVDFLNKLLAIQEKIDAFLREHANEFPSDWLDAEVLDRKQFKEDVLYSPNTKQVKLANFFKLNPEITKQVVGSEAKFEPSKDRLRALKMLGLASLVEKIDWAIEKSATPEWTRGKDVHWTMDKSKLEKDGKKAMALTFDDGPNDETEKLLDILKETDTKATFFLVGSLIAGREHIVKRIIDEGHDVGVHEWAQEGARPNQGIKEYSKRFVGPRKDLGDVKRTAELIENITGDKPTIGRMAGVHGTVDSLREFQSMELQLIHGNPYDVMAIPPSKTLKAETLLKRALSSNGQGRIRIFHIGTMKDTGLPLEKSEIDYDRGEMYPPDETLKMIGEYIERSKNQGYTFVKVKDYIT